MPHFGGDPRPEDDGPIARDFGSPERSATAPQFNHRFPSIQETGPADRPRSKTSSLRDGHSQTVNSPIHTFQRARRSTNNSARPSLPSPMMSKSRPGRRSSSVSTLSGSIRYRLGNNSTIKAYPDSHRPGWQPGAEPGIDVTKDEPIPGLFEQDRFYEECGITVVDYSYDNYSEYELQNADLVAFLQRDRPEWAACRWICVNGLSWDVIKTLGNEKGLHTLAVEDLMNTRGRTKVDWYADQCFMLLTLQKLVRLHTGDDDDDSSSDEVSSDSSPERLHKQKLRHRLFGRKTESLNDISVYPEKKLQPSPPSTLDTVTAHSSTSHHDPVKRIRTLQRYRGGVNLDRIDYLERQSALTENDLAVSVEQVSMFLLADNTVITFFEHSAEDVLHPILARIRSQETIIRRSSDASMLTQAVIDTIIDLALPVAAAYDDAIGDLEMSVLTDPDIDQPKRLYTLMSEITLLRNTISPIGSLVNSMRDHAIRPDSHTSLDTNTAQPSTPGFLFQRNASFHPSQGAAPQQNYRTPSSVTISALTHTYLSDVSDHIIALNTTLATQTKTAENLTSLLFNTMSAHQNQTMKQLTTVTVFFLPLTFLVGYFGQNFHDFDAILGSDAYFWQIAVPVTFATMMFIGFMPLVRFCRRVRQKFLWWRIGRRRASREEERVRRAVARQRGISGVGVGGVEGV